jgi:hypothetical protein
MNCCADASDTAHTAMPTIQINRPRFMDTTSSFVGCAPALLGRFHLL